MNSIEYRDAIEERNKLYDEITALSDDNYELSKKISSLDINDEDNDENIGFITENSEFPNDIIWVLPENDGERTLLWESYK